MQTAPQPLLLRPTPAARKTTASASAVTNGKRLHVVAPGDTRWARRFRDILGQIIADLGGQ